MEPFFQAVLTVLCSSGVASVVVAILNRHWAKKDKEDDKLAALVTAQKVLMIDRVRYLGQRYINQGGISLADKENLLEMHKTYRALGGNGHLDTIMAEVDELPILKKGA